MKRMLGNSWIRGRCERLEDLAAYLRSEREKRGISLQMIQEKTKIRLRYLKAIEAARFDIIPGEVYVKGFLRSYAEVIGLDGSEVVRRYKQLRMEQEKEQEVARQDAGRPKPGKRAAAVVVLMVALAIVAAFVYHTFTNSLPGDEPGGLSGEPLPGSASSRGSGDARKRTGSSDDGQVALMLEIPDVTEITDSAAAGVAGERPVGDTDVGRGLRSDTGNSGKRIDLTGEGSCGVAGSGTVGTEADGEIENWSRDWKKRLVEAAPAGETEVQTDGQPALRIDVRIDERCWFDVETDGKPVYTGILEKGETTSWEAEKEVRVKLGYAEGVLFTVNGTDVGRIGSGVMTHVFRASDF